MASRSWLPRPRRTFQSNAIYRGYSGGLLSLISPAIIVRRNALQKGVLGGNRVWLAVFAGLWLKRFISRNTSKQSELVSVERLTKGQFVSVRSIAPPSRRQRRALRTR
ncbi:MAG: hypothetical protein WD023_08735 [Ilumatobacteraceae bacterium]